MFLLWLKRPPPPPPPPPSGVMIAAKKDLLAEEVNLPEAKGEVIFSKITLANSHPSINKYSLTVLHEAIKILYSYSFLFEWCGTDEGSSGVRSREAVLRNKHPVTAGTIVKTFLKSTKQNVTTVNHVSFCLTKIVAVVTINLKLFLPLVVLFYRSFFGAPKPKPSEPKR